MNQYVLSYTKKPISFKSDIVLLAQYMVFKNVSDLSKYMIIKLKSQSPRDIDEVMLELTQFDSDNTKLSKAHHVLSNLGLAGYGMVVPYEKIAVQNNCHSVQCSLIQAKSKGRLWINGYWQHSDKDQEAENGETKRSSDADFQENDIVHIDYRKRGFPFHLSLFLLFIYLILLLLVLPALIH